jgi:hypothetical protein
MRLALLVLLGALTACCATPPHPVNPPEPDVVIFGDAGGSSDCERACRKLNSLGCAEGQAQSCATVCARSEERHFTNLHLTCVIDASDVAAVRACGYSCK